MHSLVIIGGLLYASTIVIGSFVAVALLYNNTIAIARSSLLNISKLLSILTSAIKGF